MTSVLSFLESFYDTITLDWFETYGPLVGGILFILVIALVMFAARRRVSSRTPVPPAPSTIPVVPALPVSPAQAAQTAQTAPPITPGVSAVQSVPVM